MCLIKITVFVILTLLFVGSICRAQNSDVEKENDGDKSEAQENIICDVDPFYKISYKEVIVPSVLIVYGITETILADNYQLLNYRIAQGMADHSKITIDDITQYVPAISVYALNIVGIQGRHNLLDRTMIAGLSGVFVGTIINTLKYTTKVERPDKSAMNSFPSGHTAMAFGGAEFLRKEYEDVSVWYGISGYVVAIGTGMLRIYNNKHWFADVIVGASVGILGTKLAYQVYPFLRWRFNKKRNMDEGIFFCPYYNGKQGGISCSIQL
jgi:membrane-associated phospholipid phosphatase